jgi:hypothetical protein
VTNHFAPKLIINLTGDVENCAPVLCSAEGRGSCHKGVRRESGGQRERVLRDFKFASENICRPTFRDNLSA